MSLVLALAIGLLAAACRVLSSPDLANDHYMHLAWAQQVLFGDLPGRDFVDPGMPLTYLLSAAVQHFWSGPFAEVVLCATMIGLAAAVTCLVAQKLSGSWAIAIAVSLLEVAIQPRLYSYDKILVPAVTLLLVQRDVQKPETPRLAWLGIWTGVAFLLRHDLAVYAFVGVACALVAMWAGSWARLFNAGWKYTAASMLTVLPYLAYVQWAEGIPEHLRRTLEFGRADEHQFVVRLPAIDTVSGGWSRTNATAFLFYATYGLLMIVVGLVLLRRREPREQRSAAAAAAGLLAAYIMVILRHPIEQRLPDLAAVLALTGAIVAGAAFRTISTAFATRAWLSVMVSAITAMLFAATVSSVWVLANVSDMLGKTGVRAGVRGLRETSYDRLARGSVWPWTGAWPTREQPAAIAYLAACTEPDDALLLTWRAPEYNFFARRKFAAGHAEMLGGRSYVTQKDQTQMLGWLARQRVPIVLINQNEYPGFARAYPLIDTFITGQYSPVGRYTNYDDAVIVIAVRNGLQAARTWGPDSWPCGFASRAE